MHTGWRVSRAWCESSTKRGCSAWRLSNPVRGSRIASSRWCSSAACSAHTIDTTLASSANVAITGTGLCTAAAGSTPTVTARISPIVMISATITTCGRKRAAAIADGSTIHGNAGLCGPPLIATPTPSSSNVIRIAYALTRSGCWLVTMRRSTLMKFSAEHASSSSVHQPIHGAAMISAAPTANEPILRIIRTRSFASTTRLRSSSVGHSQDTSLMRVPSTGGSPILRRS
jgi:hypothetical protein